MFFRKLNQQFLISQYAKTGRKIEYGMDTPMGFAGIKYFGVQTSDEHNLLKVIPENYHDQCKLSLMEINYKIPPHKDNGVEAIINFYIKTSRCITQFYYPPKDYEQDSEGAVFYDGYLKKTARFMAHPGDAYLVDASKPHSVIPNDVGMINRVAICLEIPNKTFYEAIEMLEQTGYADKQ
jgi:hypothetical protein